MADAVCDGWARIPGIDLHGQIPRAFGSLGVAMLLQHNAEIEVEPAPPADRSKTGVAHLDGALPLGRRSISAAPRLSYTAVLIRVEFDGAAECLDLAGMVPQRAEREAQIELGGSVFRIQLRGKGQDFGAFLHVSAFAQAWPP